MPCKPHKKAANGSGSVYRRKDTGRWYAELVLRYDAEGKPVRWRSAPFRTEREADDALATAKVERRQGKLVGTSRQTFAQFAEAWLADEVRVNRRYSTYTARACDLRRHILPALGGVRLTDITPEMVRRLQADLTRSGLAPATVLRVRSTLSAVLNNAVDLEALARSPASRVKRPRQPRAQRQPLSLPEAHSLLAVAVGWTYEAAVALGLYAGLRIGEALALRWSDVDWEGQAVRVRQGVTLAAGGGVTTADPKSDTSARDLPLTEQGLAALRRQQSRCKELRLRAGAVWREHDLVCPGEHGATLPPKTYRTRYFYPLCERAGLVGVTPHRLRHTTSTLLLAAGVQPVVIQEIMGHSSPVITLGVYGHSLPRERAEAMAKLGAMLA